MSRFSKTCLHFLNFSRNLPQISSPTLSLHFLSSAHFHEAYQVFRELSVFLEFSLLLSFTALNSVSNSFMNIFYNQFLLKCHSEKLCNCLVSLKLQPYSIKLQASLCLFLSCRPRRSSLTPAVDQPAVWGGFQPYG